MEPAAEFNSFIMLLHAPVLWIRPRALQALLEMQFPLF